MRNGPSKYALAIIIAALIVAALLVFSFCKDL